MAGTGELITAGVSIGATMALSRDGDVAVRDSSFTTLVERDGNGDVIASGSSILSGVDNTASK